MAYVLHQLKLNRLHRQLQKPIYVALFDWLQKPYYHVNNQNQIRYWFHTLYHKHMQRLFHHVPCQVNLPQHSNLEIQIMDARFRHHVWLNNH